MGGGGRGVVLRCLGTPNTLSFKVSSRSGNVPGVNSDVISDVRGLGPET